MPSSPSPTAAAASPPATTEASPPSVMASIVRTNRSVIARVIPIGLVSEGIEVILPIGMGLVIDHGILARSLSWTLLGALGIVLIRVAGMYLWIAQFTLSQGARWAERHRLRVALTAAALDPRSRPTDRPAGEVLSIATSDADKAADILDMLPWVLPASLVVIGSGVWFTVIDPWLGLTLLLGLAALVLVIRVVTPALSRRYDAQQSEAAEAAATATDLVQGLRVLQGLGVQSRARARYRERSRTALDAALVNARFSGVSSGLTTLVSAFMMAAIVVIAAQHTLRGAITLGTLVAVVGVARSITGQLQGLSGAPVWWATMSTSARRVRDLLADFGWTIDDPRLAALLRDEDGETGVRTQPRRGGTGGIRVSLPISTDPHTDTAAGTDIDEPVVLDVADGRIIAVACEDPRDAETLRAVLAGQREGAVLGELSLAPRTRLNARADLLVEPHRVDLFDGSLRDQLATRAPRGAEPGAQDAQDPDAWARAALHAAGAEDLLRILPEGMDSRILDRGANLSGGQRQRIALARAVAADAPVLVLSDPTTAVDAVTEQHIAEALVAARRAEDRATVILTRAPALLRACDEVIHVRAGHVVGRGAHADLMADAAYREMVQR